VAGELDGVGFARVALVTELGGRVMSFMSVDTETHFAGEIDACVGELVVDV